MSRSICSWELVPDDWLESGSTSSVPRALWDDMMEESHSSLAEKRR